MTTTMRLIRVLSNNHFDLTPRYVELDDFATNENAATQMRRLPTVRGIGCE